MYSMPGDVCVCVCVCVWFPSAMRPIYIIIPLLQDKGTHIKVHLLSHECP
jgi:hypothetical protein